MRVRLAALVIVTSVSFACSSSSDVGGAKEDADAGGDAQRADDASASADARPSPDASQGSDGGAPDSTTQSCNTLGVPPNAQQESIASNAPAATGGNVGDGTYDLVNVINFTGVGGTSGMMGVSGTAERYEIHGNTWQLATSVNGTLGHFTHTALLSGTTMTPTTTCGTALDGATPYSVSGTKLTLYVFGGRLAFVFEKQ